MMKKNIITTLQNEFAKRIDSNNEDRHKQIIDVIKTFISSLVPVMDNNDAM